MTIAEPVAPRKLRRSPLKAEIRFTVWRRDGFVCTYCQRSALTEEIVLVVDHEIPYKEGGSDDPSNLKTACRDCNFKKGPTPGPKQRWTRQVYIERNVVRALREERGLSQEELAATARISVEELDAIERGAVEETWLRVQRRLANALGVDRWSDTRLFTYQRVSEEVERTS